LGADRGIDTGSTANSRRWEAARRGRRQADADGREALEALVLQIQRDGEVMRPPLDPSIPRELREALGLGRR